MRVVRIPRPRTVPSSRASEHQAADATAGTFVSPSGTEYAIPSDEVNHDRREQHAYQRGLAEGKRIADASVETRLAESRRDADERIAGLMEGLATQMRTFAASIERDAFQFALAVAARIVKKEVQLDPETVARQIRDAMHRVVGAETIRLRVHPDDEDVIHANRSALFGSLDTIRDIAIETDESIDRGGCIIESPSGNVDARIATQLRQIEAALFGQPMNVEERVA